MIVIVFLTNLIGINNSPIEFQTKVVLKLLTLVDRYNRAVDGRRRSVYVEVASNRYR